MAHWEQWLKDFMKGWFEGLVDGIWNLREEDMLQILASLDSVVTGHDEFEPFLSAWAHTSDHETTKLLVEASFNQISEFDSRAKRFFQTWLGALISGVEKLDEDNIGDVFKYSGASCAKSFAENTFLETWGESESIESFIRGLNRKMGDGTEIYRITGNNSIEAVYPKCICPLVDFGLISSPLICNCSSSWLAHNFSEASGKEVVVERIESVRTGSDKCKFRITLE